jgi:hypothetical protein
MIYTWLWQFRFTSGERGILLFHEKVQEVVDLLLICYA